jgi:hypothetical protein
MRLPKGIERKKKEIVAAFIFFLFRKGFIFFPKICSTKSWKIEEREKGGERALRLPEE